MESNVYLLVGAMVLANGGTIIAVIGSALRISSEFGSLKKQVEINKEDITSAKNRLREIERAI